MSLQNYASTLVLVRGLPGSGKSYLVMELQEQLGINIVEILDPDMSNYDSQEYKVFSDKMSDDGVDLKFHPYRFLRSKAYEAIKSRKIIVWNQAFTNLDGFNKTVVNLQSYANNLGLKLPLLVVEVEISPKLAKQRIEQRHEAGGHDVSPEKFDIFLREYKSFNNEYDNVVILNGEKDVKENAELVLKAIEKIQA